MGAVERGEGHLDAGAAQQIDGGDGFDLFQTGYHQAKDFLRHT